MSFALAMVGSSPTAQWAAILTIFAEGLVITGFVIGVGGGLLRWQKKKDRLEEEKDRQQVREEVATQLNGFRDDIKKYLDTRINDLSVGIDRTVRAVEENTGSSIPDALARIERRQGTIDAAIQGVVAKVSELDRKVKSNDV